LLSVLLVILGGSVARYYGAFHWAGFGLCLLGLVLLHISANVLNDYFDYTSGIDLATDRTPFNGGSGLLNEGLLTPRQALLFGLAAFALAVPIGGYLLATIGWALLPMFVLGSALVLGNTSHIAKLGYGLGELSAGLGLGALPVFGTAWVVHGSPAAEFLYPGLPSALWVFNLLLLNEFPDEQPDQAGGRKTLPVQLGFRRARWVYVGLGCAAYLWIAACVALGAMPAPCLLAFLSLPLAVKAAAMSHKPDFKGDFLKAQAGNVGLALSGHFLLALGYYWAV
jgi:1,4-dihydroxy-2-naphthoate octaprenyltransferase